MSATRTRALIAQRAAHYMLESGLDHDSAKRRAKADIALNSQQRSNEMPADEEVDEIIRAHWAIFSPNEVAEQMAVIEQFTLELFNYFAEFQPFVFGVSVHGALTENSPIQFLLVTEEEKSVEIYCANHGIQTQPKQHRSKSGQHKNQVLIFVWPRLRPQIDVELTICPVSSWQQIKKSTHGEPIYWSKSAYMQKISEKALSTPLFSVQHLDIG